MFESVIDAVAYVAPILDIVTTSLETIKSVLEAGSAPAGAYLEGSFTNLLETISGPNIDTVTSTAAAVMETATLLSPLS